jgi:hypothetical protein
LPARILEKCPLTLNERELSKLQWSNRTKEDVTWEIKDQIKAEYEYLFDHCLLNPEDEIHLKGVEL